MITPERITHERKTLLAEMKDLDCQIEALEEAREAKHTAYKMLMFSPKVYFAESDAISYKMSRIRKIVSWIRSCETHEQIETMENYIRREYLVVPEILGFVLSNQKVLISQ